MQRAWSAGGDARVRTPKDPNVRRDAQRKSKEKSGAVTESDAELVNALKACRAQLAAGKPAYVVFADSTLAAFATRRPLTPAAMLAVPGVGLLKLEKYAEPFLDVIRAHGP